MNSLTTNMLIKGTLSAQLDINCVYFINRLKKYIDSSTISIPCLSTIIKLVSLSASLLVLPLSSYAAISAVTSQTIQGSHPYFMFVDEITGTKNKMSNLDLLQRFQYKDLSGTITLSDKTLVEKPIYVHATMKINELLAYVAIDDKPYKLSTLSEPLGDLLIVSDDDGDALNTEVLGVITATLKEDDKVITSLPSTVFTPCKTYIITIAVAPETGMTKVQAKTQYGDPAYREYDSTTVSYTIFPETPIPYTCYVQPNGKYYRNSDYAGDVNQWNPEKGFIPASTTVYPTNNKTYGNFPKIGFHGAEFELILMGTTAQKVITSSTGSSTLNGIYTPKSGNTQIFVELSAENIYTNKLKVKLIGPHDRRGDDSSFPVTELPNQKHSATLVNLTAQDSFGTTVSVYNFTIEKWFIARSGVYSSYDGGGYPSVVEYCPTLKSGYRIPSLEEYTNANGFGWSGGLASNTNNNHRRTIGGGLFSEWGKIISLYFPSADFEGYYYWSYNPRTDINGWNYAAANGTGYIYYFDKTTGGMRAACVSP